MSDKKHFNGSIPIANSIPSFLILFTSPHVISREMTICSSSVQVNVYHIYLHNLSLSNFTGF